MLSERALNELAARPGEVDHARAAVLGVIAPRNEALSDQPIDGGRDGSTGQLDHGADPIHLGWPFVEENFQHSEVREADPQGMNMPRRVRPQ